MLARRLSPFVLPLTVLLLVSRPATAWNHWCSYLDGTLFETIREADLVVVARIANVSYNDLALTALDVTTRLERRLRGLGVDVTLPTVEPTPEFELEVIETLKGKPRSRLRLPATGSALSTDPATPQGGEIVFFLKSRFGSWVVVDVPAVLSNPTDADDFRKMVRRADAVDPSALKGPGSPRAWTVEAASLPGTRPCVLGDVYRLGDLSADELRQVAGGFVLNPGSDRHEIRATLTLLASYRSEEVDRAALSVADSLPDSECDKAALRDVVFERLSAIPFSEAQRLLASRNP